MKYTAVDWLLEQLWNTPKDKLTWYSIYKEAKEMEKHEIKRAYCVGVNESEDYEEGSKINSEKYYKERFNNDITNTGTEGRSN